MKEEALFNQAKICLDQGNYEQAIALLDQCIENDAEEVNYYWYLGLAYLLEGQEEIAREVLLTVFLQGTIEEGEQWTQELVSVLEKYCLSNLIRDNISTIARVYRLILEIYSDYQNEKISSFLSLTLQFFAKQAQELVYLKKYPEAIEKYQAVLKIAEDDLIVWNSLAIAYYESENYPQAYAVIIQALLINDEFPALYYTLGLIFEKLDQINSAIEAYQKTISLDPSLVNAHNNLGNLFKYQGDFYNAKLAYLAGIESDPTFFGGYVNLGNLLLEQEEYKEAIEIYDKALHLQPGNSLTLYNLGLAHERKGDLVEAALNYGYSAYREANYPKTIENFEAYLSEKTGPEQIYLFLTDSFIKTSQIEKAIKVNEDGLSQHPLSLHLHRWLAYGFHFLGDLKSSYQQLQRAIDLFPNDVSFKKIRQSLLPILYNTKDEIEVYRTQYIKYLRELIIEIDLTSPEFVDNFIEGLSYKTNFFLQYQGKNDLDLQKQYGQLVHEAMSAKYPEWISKIDSLNKQPKYKIGYVSLSMYQHTVGKLMLGWLKFRNIEKYEVYSYYPNASYYDILTERYEVYSDHFHHFWKSTLEEMCSQILGDKLDILVFLDIGMNPLMTQLAGLRLASIQCTSWGHPITSGSPTIDYFLSSDLMEPEHGEEHYSETLIRLPNIGIAYPRPELPEERLNRYDFELKKDAVLYLSCQSLFKYLPQYDYLFPEIALRVPNAQFVFLASNASDNITEQFHQRLQKVFACYHLEGEQYCVILPRLNHNQYLNLNLMSDIFLDSLSWSGGNTTLEALAFNLPVVTYPGEFMRGRHACGILKALGVTETIASSEAEYVEIAVKLGLDLSWRQEIKDKISINSYKIYDDQTAIKGLEDFYEKAIQAYPQKLIHFSYP